MDYKQKYNEALERAKAWIENRCMPSDTNRQGILEDIFHELKESEDERIRKALIENFELLNGKQFKNQKWGAHEELLIDDILAWLEKQGKQKPNPYSGTSFKYNGHTWGMCARDNGVDILCDKHIIGHLEKQGESYTKKDVVDLNEFVKEYSFNIPSDIYNFLPKEKQSKWINEIESAVRAGVQWFEKQGEQKSSDEILKIRQEVYQSGYNDGYKHGCEDTKNQDEQKSQRMISAEAKEAMYDKPSDKVEPKFKVGDWVVYYRNDSSREVLQVYDIRDGRYYFTDNVHFSWSVKECDEKSHLWTIQDAKDGDVLVFKNNIGGIIICKSPTYYDTRSYCRLVSDNLINKEESGWDSTLLVPATKEQRDLLFQKMKEAGYEWDAEKKELKKIEKKSTWNEDDERIYQSIIDDTVQENQLNCEQTNWLRDIKYRYFQQPKQEWSEEDEEIMSGLLSFLLINTSDQWAKYGKWILSLKERMRK